MRYKPLLLSAAILMASVSVFGQGQQQLPPAAQSDSAKPANTNQPVTGKTSERGTAINTSNTKTTGEETPGVQTDIGQAQRHGKKTTAPPAHSTKSRPGAPPNWEQVGEQPAQADRDAAAASRAEIGGPQGTLGVKGNVPPEDQSAAARGNSAGNKSARKGSSISGTGNQQSRRKPKAKRRTTAPASTNKETGPQR